MTNYLGRFLTGVLRWNSCLHAPSALPLIYQTRNTFIFKRRNPPGLTKNNRRATLRSRHYVYDLVEDTAWRKSENLDVILTSYVQGLGDKGSRVSVKRNYGYDKLLLPGLAVYASPENIKKFENISVESKAPKFSSPAAERTLNILSNRILSIHMNQETEWTLEPWHIRMTFRKAGFVVPEYAVEMPKQPIRGPDLNLEGKEFMITVTVNKTEKVRVKCRIYHYSTNPADRLPCVAEHWLQPAEPVFPESKEN